MHQNVYWSLRYANRRSLQSKLFEPVFSAEHKSEVSLFDFEIDGIATWNRINYYGKHVE